MRASSHVDPRRRRISRDFSLDRLEDRTMLSGAGGSRFAVYQGRLTAEPPAAFNLIIDRQGFRPGRGNQVLLRVDSYSTDGGLDPGAVDLASAGRGRLQVISERDDAGAGNGAVSIAAVGPGVLSIRPTAEGGTTGGYGLGVSLAGDVNGDFRVDRSDLMAIRKAILARSTSASTSMPGPDYDVDGDGVVGMRDWNIASRNLGAAVSVRPLELTARVAPSDDPDGDSVVGEGVEETEIVGKATPGSRVQLDIGGDGRYEAWTLAKADGSYSFTVPLSMGVNAFTVRATGADGQAVDRDLGIVRGAPAQAVSKSFDFAQGDQGWSADFADLPVDPGDTYELDAGIRDLPGDLNVDGTGYRLRSHNRSDDVFMFLTRKLTAADGVVAGQTYQIKFTIKFASNAPTGAVGIGGAPGEAVVLKAGASTVEPKVVQVDGYDRLNVDKGNNSEGGTAASVVGNIANGLELQDGQASVPYVSLTREHTHSATVKADAAGNLWLIVGTDSGFEGLTAVYFQSIGVTLTPVSG